MKECTIPSTIQQAATDAYETLQMQIAEADEEYSNFYLEGKEEEMKKVENIQAAIRRILIGNEV